MIITISGMPGSGKSTVAKALAKRLGYRHFSTGDLRGRIAMKHGLTIDQLNEIGKKESWTDRECDDLVADMGRKEDDIVFDTWLAWHFIPKAVKIFLTVEPKVAAERVFRDQRPDEPRQRTIEGVRRMLGRRYRDSVERYKKWYKVDISDRKHYDCVIDTTKLNPGQTVQRIVDFLKGMGKV